MGDDSPHTKRAQMTSTMPRTNSATQGMHGLGDGDIQQRAGDAHLTGGKKGGVFPLAAMTMGTRGLGTHRAAGAAAMLGHHLEPTAPADSFQRH